MVLSDAPEAKAELISDKKDFCLTPPHYFNVLLWLHAGFDACPAKTDGKKARQTNSESVSMVSAGVAYAPFRHR